MKGMGKLFPLRRPEPIIQARKSPLLAVNIFLTFSGQKPQAIRHYIENGSLEREPGNRSPPRSFNFTGAKRPAQACVWTISDAISMSFLDMGKSLHNRFFDKNTGKMAVDRLSISRDYYRKSR
jgi:hypothetical protein